MLSQNRWYCFSENATVYMNVKMLPQREFNSLYFAMCVYIQEAEKFPRVLLLKVILICDVTQYSMCFIFVQNCQSNPNRTDMGHVSHEFALSSGFRPLASGTICQPKLTSMGQQTSQVFSISSNGRMQDFDPSKQEEIQPRMASQCLIKF